MSVYNILYDGRKQQVKPSTPNVLLQAVVTEAANAFGIDPAQCSLRLKQKNLDLSQSIRFAGIPNHSNLDLVVTGSSRGVAAVAVDASTKVHFNVNSGALQISDTVEGNLTLFAVLQHFIDNGSLPAHALNWLQDVLYIRTAFTSISQLQTTTLQTLGVLGQTVKFHLRYREEPESISTVAAAEVLAPIHSPIYIDNSNATDKSNIDNSMSGPTAADNSDSQTTESTRAMDMDESQTAESVEDVKAERAVRTLLQQNFDAVSRVAVPVLVRYLQNLLARPDESVVRAINLQNKVFVEKVLVARGATEVLLTAGFRPDPQQSQKLVFNATSLRMVNRTLAALKQAMDELQMTSEERPPEPTFHSDSNNSSKMEFDPFRSFIVRPMTVVGSSSKSSNDNVNGNCSGIEVIVSTDGRANRGRSVTDDQLAQLRKRRRELEGLRGSVRRSTKVLYPGDFSSTNKSSNNDVDDSNEDESATTAAGAGAGSKAVPLPRSVLQRTLNALSGDGSSDAPLTTRAVRQLQKLQQEKVYSSCVLRVRLSDRLQFVGHFHPRDTLVDVYLWLRHVCLQEQVSEQFLLNTSSFSVSASTSQVISVYQPDGRWEREEAGSAPLSLQEEQLRLEEAQQVFLKVCELYTTPPRTVYAPGRTPGTGTVNEEDEEAEQRSALSPSLTEVGLTPAAVLNLQWRQPPMIVNSNNNCSSERQQQFGYVHQRLQETAGGKAGQNQSNNSNIAERPVGITLAPVSSASSSVLAAAAFSASSATAGAIDSSSDAKQPSGSKPKWFKL